MPPFRRHLLYLTTEHSSTDEKSFLTSTTGSPTRLEPTADDSILVTPAPPSRLLASLHTRSPASSQTSDAPDTEQKCETIERVQDDRVDAMWPLSRAVHDGNEWTDHYRSQSDNKGKQTDPVKEGNHQGSRSMITHHEEGQTRGHKSMRNFSRPFISTTARLSPPSLDVLNAKAANSASIIPRTATISPRLTNAMKETQSTKAKQRSPSSPVASQSSLGRRDGSVISRTSTPDRSPLAAKSPAGPQLDNDAETRNVVARSTVLPSGARTSSLPSSRSRFGSGGSGASFGRSSVVNGGIRRTKTGPDVKVPSLQSLKRQRSSHASQASLNERYRHQEASESPKPPPKNVPGLIGIAWSGIADEWWPPRSSSRCRYTQTARKTQTAHRLSSINELREDLAAGDDQKHNRILKSQPAESTTSPKGVSQAADASRDSIDQQNDPNRSASQLHADRTPTKDKRRDQNRVIEKSTTKKDQTNAMKDAWGSTIVIKKRREGEMMKIREKAVWW